MKCFSTLSCIFPFSSLLLFYILHICSILMYPVVLYEGTRMKTYLCKVQVAKLKAPLVAAVPSDRSRYLYKYNEVLYFSKGVLCVSCGLGSPVASRCLPLFLLLV